MNFYSLEKDIITCEAEGVTTIYVDTVPISKPAPMPAFMGLAIDYIRCSRVSICPSFLSTPFYDAGRDMISIAPLAYFKSASLFAQILYHELTHSTGGDRRLKRIPRAQGITPLTVAREELIAEIGSLLLCEQVGATSIDSRRNSIIYLRSWLTHWHGDAGAMRGELNRAFKKAEIAVDYFNQVAKSNVRT